MIVGSLAAPAGQARNAGIPFSQVTSWVEISISLARLMLRSNAVLPRPSGGKLPTDSPEGWASSILPRSFGAVQVSRLALWFGVPGRRDWSPEDLDARIPFPPPVNRRRRHRRAGGEHRGG